MIRTDSLSEQEKVYKKRLCDLEVGIVLGRQNYALKSITCEKLQAEVAVRILSLILDRRPSCLADYVKKFEKSYSQWTKLAAELSSLSGQTLKFYTNQLRALQENETQLMELPVLPNVSVTTQKGKDPTTCLSEFLDQLSIVYFPCKAQIAPHSNEEHVANTSLCTNSVWSRLV